MPEKRRAQPKRPPRKPPKLSRRAIAANRAVEAAFRRGEISFEAFDWWLRSISGV